MTDFGQFRGFGDKLFQGQLPTNLGTIGSITFAYDVDAQAFFNRVTTAGGNVTDLEKAAVNELVIDLKTYSIWSKMKAIYPMVGASAAACAQNLKSSSFTGVFNGGWTFTSTGATPNGTNAFFNTNLNMLNDLSQDNSHACYYSRTNVGANLFAAIGVGQGNANAIQLYPNYDGFVYAGIFTSTALISSIKTATNTLGLKLINRINATQVNYFDNTIKTTATQASVSGTNLNVYLAAENQSTGARRFSPYQCALSSLGNGLTDTEASNFYTAVQAFQTTLSRQV